MTFFALVHGGAHGGWCWEEVVPRLEALGHQCSAPDLPFGEADGVSEWADEVIASIPPATNQDVVVVGHSLGGIALPVVAARRSVKRLVFLAAMVPIPGKSLMDVYAAEPDAVTVSGVKEALHGEPAPELVDPDDADADADAVMPWARARESFYLDLPEEVARRAWRRLRPQGMLPFTEPCPLDAWPDVPSTYIVMTDDRAVNPQWSRRVATGRLGADLIELPGSHSPFYANPEELVRVLDAVSLI